MFLDVVILAAGKGTRMRSARAKVLHTIGGKPMLQHVLDTARQLAPRQICPVIGHQGDEVRDAIDDSTLTWVEQAQQLGTGHAVREAMAHVADDGVVLVLYGDVPLIGQSTLKTAVSAATSGDVGLVTAVFADPAELGRIVRNARGDVTRIVEFKDADESTRQINEINSGIVAVPAADLNRWLNQLDTDNAQGELYLTDIIEMAENDGKKVTSIAAQPHEVIGVNDRVQLAEVERLYQAQQTETLMRAGTTMQDPSRVDIRGEITVGEDCLFDVNVVLEGKVVLGDRVQLGPGVVIKDSVIGDGTVVHAYTTIDGATVAAECSLGPFARIRPLTVLDEGVRIGNFVETKKSHLGAGSKANHLAYLGDATLGRDCNVGAGAITANYDGVNKYETHAGDNVFVGTNVTMVAPLNLQDWAFLAAGSTVTNDVGENDLAVARGKQRVIRKWTRPDQAAAKKKASD
ncbi:MAG: bifunctional UDP-N-acetylglucosamine diphosphorylase/glucosamine-1-phosphate N-acetyltransferase GlmU [Pseudomonadales bacterium]